MLHTYVYNVPSADTSFKVGYLNLNTYRGSDVNKNLGARIPSLIRVSIKAAAGDITTLAPTGVAIFFDTRVGFS